MEQELDLNVLKDLLGKVTQGRVTYELLTDDGQKVTHTRPVLTLEMAEVIDSIKVINNIEEDKPNDELSSGENDTNEDIPSDSECGTMDVCESE